MAEWENLLYGLFVLSFLVAAFERFLFVVMRGREIFVRLSVVSQIVEKSDGCEVCVCVTHNDRLSGVGLVSHHGTNNLPPLVLPSGLAH